MKINKCIGFGDKEWKCQEEIDTEISVYWCTKCERARREYITKQFENAVAGKGDWAPQEATE